VHLCLPDTVDPRDRRRSERDVLMESGREISIDIAQDEWTAMVNESDVEG
jgi:hypothetical protein